MRRNRLCSSPLTLGRADATALADEAGGWGSYYDHEPAVLAGDLRTALHHLRRGRVGSDGAG
jgi:hypothetical protein